MAVILCVCVLVRRKSEQLVLVVVVVLSLMYTIIHYGLMNPFSAGQNGGGHDERGMLELEK